MTTENTESPDGGAAAPVDQQSGAVASPNRGASARITAVVSAWPGVSSGTGSRGEWSLRLGKRELGHLHGDRILHVGFPKAVWHELYDAGRIDYHSVFPGKPGYAARAIETEADVQDVIALLRINYDRSVAAHGVPAEVEIA